GCGGRWDAGGRAGEPRRTAPEDRRCECLPGGDDRGEVRVGLGVAEENARPVDRIGTARELHRETELRELARKAGPDRLPAAVEIAHVLDAAAGDAPPR